MTKPLKEPKVCPKTGRLIYPREYMRQRRVAEANLPSPISFDGPPRVAGYVRVSTDRQAQSPADQRMIITRLAEANNITIESFYQDAPVQNQDGSWNDAQSGKVHLADRPAGGEMDRRLRPGAGDIVVVSRMDRLFRKLSDCVVVLDRWERLGVRLLAGDFPSFSNLADPYSKAIQQMMAVFAELNRKLIVARTKEALACRTRAKRAVSFYPGYGFKFEARYDPVLGKKVKHKVADPEERALMKQIAEWRLQGNTWEQIYWHFQKLKIRTRTGKEWSRDRIYRSFYAELQLQLMEHGQKPKESTSKPTA